MEPPILIDQSPPEFKEWGKFRMPKVYRLPTGQVCLTFSISTDHYCDQGRTSPPFVSDDEGQTWERTAWPHPGIGGMEPVITPILNGEFYSIPAGKGIELDISRLPKSVGTFELSAGFSLHRLEDCPDDVIRWFKDIKAVRWSPRTKTWAQETVQWDHRGQLLWYYNDRPQKITGDWSQKIYLENPIIRNGKELLHADYWTAYAGASGRMPVAWECSLMVSTDNARSWTRRSTMAIAPEKDNICEPVIELNQAGALVGVTRRETNNRNPSMYLVHSEDRGFNWSEPQTLHEFGVFPRLLQLENGVLVLTFGRPGVWMSFSLDGGHSWTQPQAVIVDPSRGYTSCGYTSLVALSRDSFLLAYSDVTFPNTKGEPCKSILVRRVEVTTQRR